MRHLYLLRHAKSSWDETGLPDHDRPLNRRGRDAAATLGRFLLAEGVALDRAYCSSARRTVETTECMNLSALGCSIESAGRLYLASVDELLTWIHGIDDGARSVLLVGHNPGIAQLAETLVGEESAALSELRKKFPTGALAEISFSTGSWRQVVPGAGRLLRFLPPRDLLDSDP